VSARPPRILAIMGSGETAPTMVTPHREIVARLGEPTPRAVLLDTPYGFQENASEITERAVEYFAHRVQLTIEASGFLGPLAVDQSHRAPLAEAAALSRLRTAGFVFAGPGSPSYALSVWRSSPVPEALTTKLAEGGAVVFSSAAALTLGSFSIPVYEIYKVGQPVHWLDGLGLMRAAGFEGSCVVIPHYDNAEGGTHDTRFCYLGERRLAVMEGMLPQDAWVLGIDEHTVLIVDLDARTVAISGRGSLTVRRRGASQVFAAGQRLGLDALLAAARGDTARARAAEPAVGAAAVSAPKAEGAPAPRSPLLAEVARLEQAFEAAIAGRKATEAAEAILNLDRAITEWSADTLQTDDPDRARAILYSLVQRLGEAAAGGLRDPRELMAPLVENLITLRGELRAARAFELADRVRDRLIAARIELRDTPGGTVWELRE
jgi:cyanophycinase-like exopeptidase